MPNTADVIKEELRGIALLIGTLWAVFLLDQLIYPVDFNQHLGLVPRTLRGLWGIPLMPLLHGSVAHLAGNTIPLFVLLMLLAGSHDRSWYVVTQVVLLGGALLWVFGLPTSHVGASGLIFALIAFLIVVGLLRRRVVPLMVSLIVGFLYGGTLLWGILPGLSPEASWDGHLCGAMAGTAIALSTGRRTTRQLSG